MLYDKRWDKTKADPFSLESLISWLEMQPAAAQYSYYKSGACLIGQWVHAVDLEADEPADEPSFIYTVHGKRTDLEHYHDIAVTEPWTFGAALTRAKAALKVQS